MAPALAVLKGLGYDVSRHISSMEPRSSMRMGCRLIWLQRTSCNCLGWPHLFGNEERNGYRQTRKWKHFFACLA